MPKKKSDKTDRSAPPNLKTDNPKIIETIEEKKIRWSNFLIKNCQLNILSRTMRILFSLFQIKYLKIEK